MKVENKKIIVTGVSSGIGKELTKILIKKNAYVIGVDVDEKGLKELEEELKTDKLDTYTVNMADEKQIKDFVKKVMKKHENIDGLINNAGIIQPFVEVGELTDEIINRVMDVNFNGPVLLVRLLIDHLKQRPIAHIVNVSSMAGFFPFPNQTMYGASKAALKIFTEGLYAENIGTNLNVSIVFPGAIATNITKNSNLKVKEDGEDSGWKSLAADKAANIIVDGMEKGLFQIYVGNDAKFMNRYYRLTPKGAIHFVKNKMGDL